MPERSENILNKDGFYITVRVQGTDAATASNYGVFFIAKNPCEVFLVSEVHEVAGTDAGAVELNIEQLTSGTALNSGNEILVTDFNLKSTANTPVEKEGTALQNRQLKRGERLALKDIGTLTSVDDVCVTIYFKPLGKGHYA